MGKIWMPFQTQSVKSWEDLSRFSNQAFQNIYAVLNKKVSFGDNIDCQIVDVDLTTAISTIPHKYGTIPYGFLVLNQNANANIWSATLAWNQESIYLQASGNVTAKIAILGG